MTNWKHSYFRFLAAVSHSRLTSSLLYVWALPFLMFKHINITDKAKLLLSPRWTGTEMLSVLLFCLTRFCGGTGWTLSRSCHVSGGLLHHLHDRAIRLCHLHQWSPRCWGSLLYPLYLCITTSYLLRRLYRHNTDISVFSHLTLIWKVYSSEY